MPDGTDAKRTTASLGLRPRQHSRFKVSPTLLKGKVLVQESRNCTECLWECMLEGINLF